MDIQVSKLKQYIAVDAAKSQVKFLLNEKPLFTFFDEFGTSK